MITTVHDFPCLMRGKQPLLGLDIGTKTIGISLSDRTWTIANALLTIKRIKFSADLKKLIGIIQEHAACGLVVGWPLNMDGQTGPRCQSVRDYCKLLMQTLNIPILLFDERLSTVAVTNMMLSANLSRKRRSELVDKLAAAFILQNALDNLSRCLVTISNS